MSGIPKQKGFRIDTIQSDVDHLHKGNLKTVKSLTSHKLKIYGFYTKFNKTKNLEL